MTSLPVAWHIHKAQFASTSAFHNIIIHAPGPTRFAAGMTYVATHQCIQCTRFAHVRASKEGDFCQLRALHIAKSGCRVEEFRRSGLEEARRAVKLCFGRGGGIPVIRQAVEETLWNLRSFGVIAVGSL